MKSYALKQDNRLKKKLFDLISTHRDIMIENRKKTEKIYTFLMKKELINQLKRIQNNKIKQEKAFSMVLKRRKLILF